MTQMKEQNKIPEKELNKTETSSLPDAEFKTLAIRMLQGHVENGHTIKKTQEEMKVTLTEIKEDLQGTSSRGDEAGIQINDLEHKEEISIQPEQQKEKRIKKKKNPQGQYKEPLGHLQIYQHLNHRDARRKRGRARN